MQLPATRGFEALFKFFDLSSINPYARYQIMLALKYLRELRLGLKLNRSYTLKLEKINLLKPMGAIHILPN